MLPVKLAIGVLMLAFALLEVIPAFENLSFDRKYLPLGGDGPGRRIASGDDSRLNTIYPR